MSRYGLVGRAVGLALHGAHAAVAVAVVEPGAVQVALVHARAVDVAPEVAAICAEVCPVAGAAIPAHVAPVAADVPDVVADEASIVADAPAAGQVGARALLGAALGLGRRRHWRLGLGDAGGSGGRAEEQCGADRRDVESEHGSLASEWRALVAHRCCVVWWTLERARR